MLLLDWRELSGEARRVLHEASLIYQSRPCLGGMVMCDAERHALHET